MDKTAFQKIERKCGYVLEYITPKGETKTREGYRKNRSTYNQEFLGALAEALERIHEPCKVTIHGQNRFALFQSTLPQGERLHYHTGVCKSLYEPCKHYGRRSKKDAG